MNLTPIALTLAIGCPAAVADVAVFNFVGTVLAVEGDVDFTAIGDAADGGFAFDLDQVVESVQNPIEPGFEISFFEVVEVRALAGTRSFESPSPLAVVVNDFAGGEDGEEGLFDTLFVAGPLVEDETRTGQITFDFSGDSVWLSPNALPDPETLGLDNLLRSSIIIEFQTSPEIAFDDNGVPIFDPNFEATQGRVTVRIDEIIRGGVTIATIGCRSAVLARPVAQADVNDALAFIGAYSTGREDADIDGDGSVDVFDAVEFIGSYSECAG